MSIVGYLKSWMSLALDTQPVKSALNVSDAASVTTLRNAIIAEVWSGNGYPATEITTVTSDVASPINETSDNLDSIDELRIEMSDNAADPDFFIVKAYHFKPIAAADTGRLLINHLGHGGDFDSTVSDYEFITVRFLDSGYHVIMMPMPGRQGNEDPALSNPGEHNAYPDPTPTLNYLKFFLEPTVRCINYAKNTLSLGDVYMCGLSGGGWTTNLMAAIDERIVKSWIISGSQPLDHPGDPDWEQELPGVVDIPADYDDMYAMACSNGRSQRQSNAERDSCCFARGEFTAGPDYTGIVQTVATALGGTWGLIWDDTHQTHTISEYIRDLIRNFFDVRTPPNTAVVNQSILDGTNIPEPDGVLIDTEGNQNEQVIQSNGASTAAALLTSEGTAHGLDMSGDFTFSMFIQWTATGVMTPFSCRSGSTNAHEQCLVIVNLTAAGSITARVAGTNVTWAGSQNDGVTHNVTITKSGTTVTLYVDGTQRAQDTVGTATGGTGRIQIGSNSTGPGGITSQVFTGVVAGVGLLPGTVMGAADIARVSAGKEPATDSWARFYPLSEDTKTTTNTRGISAFEVMGTGAHLPPNVASRANGLQDGFHWHIAKGWGGAINARVPALADGSGAADGTALTRPANGKYNHPESKLNLSANGGPAAWSWPTVNSSNETDTDIEPDFMLAPSYYEFSESNDEAFNFRRYTF